MIVLYEPVWALVEKLGKIWMRSVFRGLAQTERKRRLSHKYYCLSSTKQNCSEYCVHGHFFMCVPSSVFMTVALDKYLLSMDLTSLNDYGLSYHNNNYLKSFYQPQSLPFTIPLRWVQPWACLFQVINMSDNKKSDRLSLVLSRPSASSREASVLSASLSCPSSS